MSYTVFLGTPCIDEYYEIAEWPQMGAKFACVPKGQSAGGMIANAACVMAGYGEKVYSFCGLSKGPDTDFLFADFARNHVDTSQIILREEGTDAKCLIFQTETDRSIAVVAGDPWQIVPNEEQKAFLKGAAYLYTTLSAANDYADPLPLFNEMKEAGVRLVFDNEVTAYRKGWEDYVRNSYIVSMNEHALRTFAEGSTNEELEAKLLDLGTEIIVETLGAQGCKVLTREGSFAVPAYEVPVKDTTGAGDTFNTSFLFALKQGRELKEAAEFATAAANRAITLQGARSGIAASEEVLAFRKEYGR
ncbi:MAG: carbohydrate kinase family protein [Erysipelotrichaceae bacterium]|nr:carbohydrate kinase family protein [Erysipelotrichaceae bacterium]